MDPVWSEVKGDTVQGALKGGPSDDEDKQHKIGEGGSHIHHLTSEETWEINFYHVEHILLCSEAASYDVNTRVIIVN